MRQDRRQQSPSRVFRHIFVTFTLLAVCVGVWLNSPFSDALAASLPSNASCAQLARVNPTATNGSYWGKTILPGFGATGGWFGVPICANGVNQVAPGGANVSCDRVPANFGKTGCAPGSVTNDGYGWSFQCVELVIRFTAWAFGAPTGDWHGDAQYLWLSGHHPTSFTPYASGGTMAPTAGDILVWGSLDSQGRPWPAGPAGGHVAVVAATGPGWITFVEENVLVRGGNVPEETTTLTQRNGHWTIGHTYAANGGRAIYGWLHESGDSGRFSGSGSHTTPSSASTAPALPSLADGVIVTGAGALAQLVWSDTRTAERPARETSAARPSALAESLGAPPGATLAPDQRPAVVTLPGGARYVFALGQDGRLYAAYTPGSGADNPISAEVLWQNLAAPPGLTLTSEASALWDGRKIVTAALTSDGAVWARSGPPGMLGQWISLGKPASASFKGFQGTPSLIRAPGTPASSATTTASWIALAVGRDGALYEADGHSTNASSTASATKQADWAAWTTIAINGLTSTLTGALVAVAEPVTASVSHSESGTPATGVVDLIATDSSGNLWLLHRETMSQSWQARAVRLPYANTSLIGATPGANALTLYVSDSGVNAATPTATAGSTTILTASAPLSAGSGAESITWSALGYATPPSATVESDAASLPIALAFGASPRALLVARGSEVSLIADPATLSLLAPGGKVSPTTEAASTGATPAITPLTGAGTIALGNVAPATAFSDAFSGSTLDPRWALTNGQATIANVANGALTLSAPSPSQNAAITQGATAGDFTITTQVTPDASWRAGGTAQAGVTLALDRWNQVTLSDRADGSVALCPVVGGKAQACSTVTAPASASGRPGLFLRLSLSAGSVRGEVSVTGNAWTLVGTWRLPWLATAGTPLGAYAPLVTPAGAANPGGYGAVPLAFTSLSLSVSGAAAPAAAGGQTTSGASGATAQFSSLTVVSGAATP